MSFEYVGYTGLFLTALGLMTYLYGVFQSPRDNEALNDTLKRHYDHLNKPLPSVMRPLLRRSLGVVTRYSQIVSVIAFIFFILAIFFLNTFVEWAYEASGNGDSHVAVADKVAALKSFWLWTLIGSWLVGFVIALFTLPRLSGGSPQAEQLVSTGIFVLTSIVGSVIFMFKAIPFISASYMTILDDIAQAGMSWGFVKAQFWLIPLHVIVLGFPSLILACLIVYCFPVLRRVDVDGKYAEMLRSLRQNAKKPEEEQAVRDWEHSQGRFILSVRNATLISGTFVSGLAISYMLTVAMGTLGTQFSAETEVAYSAQLLFWNAIFDGLTVTVTIFAIAWALQGHMGSRLIPAFLIDIGLAAFLAYLSLSFGLMGTEAELKPSQILMLLFGQTTDGQTDLGPYFWIMHSTFIPTVVIWFSFLIVGLLGKVIADILILPVFTRRGRERRKTWVHLSAEMLSAGIFLAGAGAVLSDYNEDLMVWATSIFG